MRGGTHGSNGEDADWLECRSNEDNQSDFEYKFEEDAEVMIVKKFKRRKEGDPGLDYISKAVQVTIKDPFFFQEDVVYPELNDPRNSEFPNKAVYDALLNLSQVLPLGYPTEQFMRATKQDVHHKVEEHRAYLRTASIAED